MLQPKWRPAGTEMTLGQVQAFAILHNAEVEFADLMGMTDNDLDAWVSYIDTVIQEDSARMTVEEYNENVMLRNLGMGVRNCRVKLREQKEA
jgi:hypothetical protein